MIVLLRWWRACVPCRSWLRARPCPCRPFAAAGWGLLAGIVVAAVTAIAIVAVLLWRGDAGEAEEIRFEVTGPADAALTLNWRAPGDGLSEFHSRPALPWSQTVEVHTRTGPVNLNVMTRPGQPVTCRISVGREVVEETGEVARCFTTLQRAFAP